jgi:hypothetical protein
MAPAPERKWKTVELGIALLALLVSGITIYRSEFRGPHTRLSFGPLAEFLGPSIIGLNCSFSNDGPATDIITYMTAQVEGTNPLLRPIWISVSDFRWTIEKGLQEHYTKQQDFSSFSTIVVPGKNHENRTVWFRSDDRGFKFDSRDYRLVVRAYGTDPSDLRAEAAVAVPISAASLKLLMASDGEEVSIPVEPWIGLFK